MDASGSNGGDVVELVIKNASRSCAGDFQLALPRSATLQTLKERLQRTYEGSPHPWEQTLIYAGRVLKDPALLLSDVLKEQVDPRAAHTLHLVIKPQSLSDSPAPPRAPPLEPSVRDEKQQRQKQQQEEPSPVEHEPVQVGRSNEGGAPPSPAVSEQTPAAPQVAPTPTPTLVATPSVVPPAVPQPSPGPSPSAATARADSPTETRDSQGPGQPQQYYMMNPVMAVAYNAALAALTGQPHTPDAGFMGAAMPMHAPFPMQPHMAAFGSVPMHGASQGMEGADGANRTSHPQYPYPYQPMPFPYHPHGMAYPYPYPPPPGYEDMNAPPGYYPPSHGPQHGHEPRWPSARGETAPAPRPQQPPQQDQGAAPPGEVPAAALAAAAAAGPDADRAQVRVRLIRLNLKLMLQMGVFALILYQHCSPTRFFLLIFGGLLLYLTALVPMRRVLQSLVGNNPVPRTGIIREFQMLVLGFIASLLPGWNFNPDDAAAFAAAQEMMAAEAAAPQDNNNNGREHQD